MAQQDWDEYNKALDNDVPLAEMEKRKKDAEIKKRAAQAKKGTEYLADNKLVPGANDTKKLRNKTYLQMRREGLTD